MADEFDAILANPPYVAESERAVARARDRLATSLPAALFAGADGLEVIRALLDAARRATATCGCSRSRSAPARRRPSRELIARAGFAARCDVTSRDLGGDRARDVGCR